MADWVPLGDRAIRFARPARSARAILQAVRAWPGVIDVVVARQDVAVYLDRAVRIEAGGPAGTTSTDGTDGPELDWTALIDALATAPDDPAPVRDIVLHAAYDGPDLDHVAAATGRPADEVCALHAAATYTVETMGFAPGFAYLSGLPAALELPRRTTPRTRVPAGAIAIAGLHTAVYPFDSPGGWHLIGSVIDAKMFGPDGPLLQLGDRVRFVRSVGSVGSVP